MIVIKNSPMIDVPFTIPGYYYVQRSETNELVCVALQLKVLVKYFLYVISNSISASISLTVSNITIIIPMFHKYFIKEIIDQPHVICRDESLLQPKLLECFQTVQPIRDHYSRVQNDAKKYLKKFFDKSDFIIEDLLPPRLVQYMREKLTDFAAMIEGAYASSSAFICFRDIQLSRIGNERLVP